MYKNDEGSNKKKEKYVNICRKKIIFGKKNRFYWNESVGWWIVRS